MRYFVSGSFMRRNPRPEQLLETDCPPCKRYFNDTALSAVGIMWTKPQFILLKSSLVVPQYTGDGSKKSEPFHFAPCCPVPQRTMPALRCISAKILVKTNENENINQSLYKHYLCPNYENSSQSTNLAAECSGTSPCWCYQGEITKYSGQEPFIMDWMGLLIYQDLW